MKRLFREQLKNGDTPADTVVLKAVDTIVTEGDDDRTLKFVISNETEDSYRDVVRSDGWDLTRFKKNPVVLWAHDHRQPPVAKATAIGVEGTNLVAEAKFADAETYAFADTVFRLLKEGFLKATSVGFFPKEWTYNEDRGGYDLLENELFEFSVVPVPANPDALALAVKSGIDVAPLRAWAEAVLADPVGDHDPDPILRSVDVDAILKSLNVIDKAEKEEAEAEAAFKIADDIVERTADIVVAALTKNAPDATKDPDLDEADEDAEMEKFIDDLPNAVSTMHDEIENLKAQIDQLMQKIAADEEEKQEEKAQENELFDVIDITIDATDADEVSRSILDLDVDPEELQALIRRELENQFMKQTGRLPKEV